MTSFTNLATATRTVCSRHFFTHDFLFFLIFFPRFVCVFVCVWPLRDGSSFCSGGQGADSDELYAAVGRGVGGYVVGRGDGSAGMGRRHHHRDGDGAGGVGKTGIDHGLLAVNVWFFLLTLESEQKKTSVIRREREMGIKKARSARETEQG